MKTIIVTGGARGIGKAIVYELAKQNYNIVLNYNTSENEAKQIKEDLNYALKKLLLIKEN